MKRHADARRARNQGPAASGHIDFPTPAWIACSDRGRVRCCTPARDRRLQARDPAEILVTTPESLYLILGSNPRETQP